jgi:RNA polymerase sigma-70 factor (ECF subfamily)
MANVPYTGVDARPAAPGACRREQGVDHDLPVDDELIERLRRRDEAALAALYDRYVRPAFSLALRLLHDQGLAEDVIQEVFITLWNRPEVYAPERGRFLPWLLGVTHHRAVDVLRSQAADQRRRVGSEQRDLLLDLAADPHHLADPADRVMLGLEVQAVRQALRRLPAEQQEALALSLLGGLTHSEIAERLGQPLGTVKTRLRLGLRKLRATLRPEDQATEAP